MAVIKIGELGMVALGLTRLQTARLSTTPKSSESSPALLMCIVGLIGIFVVGYAGYFVPTRLDPASLHADHGEQEWMAIVGVIMMFNSERNALNKIPTRGRIGRQGAHS